MKSLRPSLDWLLVFVPLTVGMHFLVPDKHTLIFWSACLAILPLAGWLGKATEHLAARTGEAVGALLNATFGNAAELIIAFSALRQGLHEVVKASLTGSIIGNVLLVLGLSVLCGGLKYKVQRFHQMAARTGSTMMLLAAVALVMPAAFHQLAGNQGLSVEDDLSLEISVVLLAAYGLSLLFTLHTHKRLLDSEETLKVEHGPSWSPGKALAVLAGSTALVAWMSEILVGSVEHAAHALGMTSVFIGVIVVAIIGNAAEHSTAVLMAMRNRMDLSIGIATGSSIQIALFVAPLLVVVSQWAGPRPMDLIFTPAEVLAVAIAAMVSAQISDDGESNWLEGVLLLAVYAIFAIIFYFLPETATK